MLTAIVTVLLTFLLTGLAANRVVQNWQHRNWRAQQHFADTEKAYGALQDIFDEVASLGSRRQHRMFRLLSILRDSNDDRIKERLSEYDGAVVEWNERLNVIYAKLTLHLEWRFTRRLDSEIQPLFVRLGRRLEMLTKRRLAGLEISDSEIRNTREALDRLQGELSVFHRDILKFLLDQKNKLYEAKKLAPETLQSFPTWELFKALFKPRV